MSKMALLNPCMKFFWPKAFFWSNMKMTIRKNIYNMSQGLPNPRFMQEKVQKGDFLKKGSRELKKNSCFRFLWIPRRPGTLNKKQVFFWPSKNLYRQCVQILDLRKNVPTTKISVHKLFDLKKKSSPKVWFKKRKILQFEGKSLTFDNFVGWSWFFLIKKNISLQIFLFKGSKSLKIKSKSLDIWHFFRDYRWISI